MSTPSPTIVWLRNDLRLNDNPALLQGCAEGRPVIALYILDDTSPGVRPLGGAARWWLHGSLCALASDLRQLNIPFLLRRGSANNVLNDVVAETSARAVHWNRRYDPAGIACDTAIKADLANRAICVRSFNASLLNEPWNVLTRQKTPYRVFTPYWRTARTDTGPIEPPLPTPSRAPQALADNTTTDALHALNLLQSTADWAGGLRAAWSPGEASARGKLKQFLDHGLRGYAGQRDLPHVRTTSLLSPHLRFGEIGPRTIWTAVRHRLAQDETLRQDGEKLLSELGWREFSHYLLFHFPEMERNNFNARFDRFAWRTDDTALAAWQRGRTGYPLVDAGMRELWATGHMHNRMRMIVASFLTKHLRIHWRHGEAWFWDTLVDADIAANVSNWQWVAGTGADAAPYFRIFNPILQGEKFDSAGHYVRHWVPELAALPAKLIHKPWTASETALDQAQIHLGQTYPHPIVEHGEARAAALDAFRSLKASCA